MPRITLRFSRPRSPICDSSLRSWSKWCASRARMKLWQRSKGDLLGVVGRLSATTVTTLSEVAGGTQVNYSIDATIAGKLGSMGQPVLRSKAKEMENQFARKFARSIRARRKRTRRWCRKMSISDRMPARTFGSSPPRLEFHAKVTGRAEYTHNVQLPNMLHGKIFRSGIAHGRIRRIDVSAAKALPGVHSVFTAAERLQARSQSVLRAGVPRPADSRARQGAIRRRGGRRGPCG